MKHDPKALANKSRTTSSFVFIDCWNSRKQDLHWIGFQDSRTMIDISILRSDELQNLVHFSRLHPKSNFILCAFRVSFKLDPAVKFYFHLEFVTWQGNCCREKLHSRMWNKEWINRTIVSSTYVLHMKNIRHLNSY